ncbi:MAG: HD domain-containing protein [bacterium]|nr:HD domain-containing protein [bacterium]
MEDLFSHQPPALLEAAERLAKAVAALPEDETMKPRALFVGGFVRDALLKHVSKDADMEVYGVAPQVLEDLLVTLFSGRVIRAGKAFGVLKIPLGEGLDLDVAIPRRETKNGSGHTGFLIDSDPTMSLKDAARRRDFTINAIAVDPLTHELIDPYDGKQDLENSRLCVVDPDTFVEDPLRVYRAIQFAARFDLKVEQASFNIMQLMVERGDLDELSKERVSDEIKKLLLKSPTPSRGFELMKDLGMIERYYPELAVLERTPQEPEWHPEGNVWIHTLMVLDVAAMIIRQENRNFSEQEKLQVMIGALCHDLGKPATTRLGEKHGIPRIRSLGHEEAGVEPTKNLCEKWAFSQDICLAATISASQHLKPSAFSRQALAQDLTVEQYANAVRKLLRKIYPVSWRVLLAIAESDSRGRSLPGADTEPYREGELFEKIVKEHAFDEEPKQTLIHGRDLEELGIKPGPEMGAYIRLIEDLRDQGILKTRDEALTYLKKRLA